MSGQPRLELRESLHAVGRIGMGLTPIGLLMRLLSLDPMQRKLDREAKTYWVPHNPGGNMRRYFKQY